MKKRFAAAAIALATGIAVLGIISPSARAESPAVVINEINCEGTDWVELVNTSTAAVDISGWLLTDDALTRNPARADHRYLFPAETTIGAGSRLVVEKTATGFPFGISCGNDTIRLADGAAGTLVDEVVVPTLAAEGDTWGRFPDGAGPWVETAPTQGAPNEPSSAGGGPAPDAGWVFDPSAVHVIDLTLPQSTIDALNADPKTEYHVGTFRLTRADGTTYGPLSIGVRLKGSFSFRTLADKAAFKLKFNEFVGGQRFQGLKKLTLNNMVQDPSMIHETLAYKAFRAVGVPAARSGYAYVRVNGQDYGVYTNVETYDDVSMARHFPTTQHLYEGTGVDVVPGAAGAFEVDEGNEDNRSDLDALIAAAHGNGPWQAAMNAVADLDEMTKFWAVERYLGHWDGYTENKNNYYLHSDASGRFQMLPSGTDWTWTERLSFDAGARSPSTGQSVALFSRCLAVPSCKQLYRENLVKVAGIIESLGLDSLAASTAQLLAPWQRSDPRREVTVDQIAAGVDAVRTYLRDRAADFAEWRQTPSLPPAPFKKNLYLGIGQVSMGKVDVTLPNGNAVKLDVEKLGVLGYGAPQPAPNLIASSDRSYYAYARKATGAAEAVGTYANNAVTAQPVRSQVRFAQRTKCGLVDVTWKSVGLPEVAPVVSQSRPVTVGVLAQATQKTIAWGTICNVSFTTDEAAFGYGFEAIVKADLEKLGLSNAVPLP